MKRLHVPAMLCVHPMVNGRLSLKVGIQVDFLLNGGSKGLDNFNTFGVTLPVGFSLRFGESFQVDARYNIGLTEINKNSNGNGSHSYFSLGVGMLL